MALRHRNHHHLRSAITLGTGLTALFLFVRCSVPERDFSRLHIGENAGSGGDGGDDGVLHGTAGRGGLGGLAGGDGVGDAGLGGQAGAPFIPIPCVVDGNDAGADDAGAGDGGVDDAGAGDASVGAGDASVADAVCECVDGFYRAVDADGDGARTRACSLAPGLDCDDGDGSVTHNACGGCTALPNAVGEDCLDCGAYACDGPDSVVCATKPDAVVIDPDCRCLNGEFAARDTDGDGAGTRLCEAAPGTDCNDGDFAYQTNACGGCDALPGTVGAACNQCGVYACSNGTLACVASTGAAGQRCLNATTRQTCVGTGFWSNDFTCANVCYQGSCETCTPGTYQCTFYTTGDAVQRCVTNASIGSSSYGIGWASYGSCSGTTPRCNPNNGTCTTGYLLLPRDRTFEVAPPQPGSLPWHELLNTANEADYG